MVGEEDWSSTPQWSSCKEPQENTLSNLLQGQLTQSQISSLACTHVLTLSGSLSHTHPLSPPFPLSLPRENFHSILLHPLLIPTSKDSPWIQPKSLSYCKIGSLSPQTWLIWFTDWITHRLDQWMRLSSEEPSQEHKVGTHERTGTMRGRTWI